MARTRVRWGRVGGAAAAAVTAVAVLAGGARAGQEPATRPYVARPGDTVWAIAQGLAGPGGDPRPIVDRIEGANHLRGTGLQAGQRIVLPAAP